MTDHHNSDETQAPSDQPDLSKLAEEYMDLWQKQLSSMAADKDVASLMAQSIELMNTGAMSMANMATNAAASAAKASTSSAPTNTDGPPNDGPQPHEAATTCPACGVADDAIDDLNRRVEWLEERIAALEAAPEAKRK